jgi:simple sugar transport system permease protein
MFDGYRLERVRVPGARRGAVFRLSAVLLALAVAAAVLAMLGLDPLAMGRDALAYTFGSALGLQDLGTLVAPLVMTGLAVMIAKRVNLWNIGGEGQFYMGAWAAAGIGIFVPGPAALILPLMALAGAAAGMAWIAVPAYARARANVDEVITTLLMNFIAVLIVGYFATGPWRDPGQTISASSRPIQYALPGLYGDLNIGILFALALVAGCWVLFTRTVWGYADSARYAGIPAARRVMATMLLSGAVAGIAGAIEVSGTVSRLQVGISSQFGYFGVVIAALAGDSFSGVVLAAFLMAVLINAGIILETKGLSLNAVIALTGWLLLLTGIAGVAAGYRLRRTHARTAKVSG